MTEASPLPSGPPTPPVAPFVTITQADGQPLRLETNIAPHLKPVILWMLEQAKLTILMHGPQAPTSPLVPANGSSLHGLMKKLRRP